MYSFLTKNSQKALKGLFPLIAEKIKNLVMNENEKKKLLLRHDYY